MSLIKIRQILDRWAIPAKDIHPPDLALRAIVEAVEIAGIIPRANQPAW
jgi:hypothetical protein